jgi:hypothetical protein|tara:strand:- start:1782 stop:1961 length:180 start_codon:yes stop_codon:yes gene_type:complete
MQLNELSIEKLKQLKENLIKEIDRRTIKVPEKEDDNLTYSLKRMDIKNSYFSRATGDDK